MKFDHIVVNKKEFHATKQEIALDLVGSSRILVSEKFKHNENAFKRFIGYLQTFVYYFTPNELIHKIF